MSTTSRKGNALPWIFTGHPRVHRTRLRLTCFASRPASSPVNLIPRSFDCQEEKKTLPRTLGWRLQVHLRYRGSPATGSGILTGFPFDRRDSLSPLTELTYLLGSTDPCPTLFTRNLSPLQSSKFSFEYLLLPPRSALEAVSASITAKPSSQPPRPPTRHSPNCRDGRVWVTRLSAIHFQG